MDLGNRWGRSGFVTAHAVLFVTCFAACSLDAEGKSKVSDGATADASQDAMADADSGNNPDDSSMPPPQDGAVAETPEADCNALDDDDDGLIDEEACPCRSENWNGHAYAFCDTNQNTWTNARAACKNYGYELAAINSEEENDWLADKAKPEGVEHGWWIGMYRDSMQGPDKYKWSNGDTSTYRNWAAGEPNNKGSLWVFDVERCVEFNYYPPGPKVIGKWNDRSCFGVIAEPSRGWICESP